MALYPKIHYSDNPDRTFGQQPDSNSKCNILQEDLVRHAEAEYFPGSVVQFMDNLLKFLG
jgi:hypothetical protein